MTALRIVDTPLSLGGLAAAGQSGAAPGEWYVRAPRTADEWRARAAAVARTDRSWLDRLRPALGDGARLLDRVASGGIVITTGQQPGVFGGPLYTWHKAVSALEMAAAIERELGIPAAAVFWAATDDADFTEGASTVIATPTGAQQLALTTRPPDGVPMSFAPLGAEVASLARELEAAAGSVADPRALRAAAAFAPGAMLGDAYVAMLRHLLEPLGMAVLDASHSAVGDASRDVLEAAMTNATEIHAALGTRRDAIVRAGFEPTVDVERELSLVFAWAHGRGGPEKRRLTLDEARQKAAPDVRLSPNVLLRPVVERAILPTVAYHAGPGELAYFAQVSAVADALGAAQPLAVPRWSGMAIPGDVAESLSALGLTVEDLRDPHAAEATLARAALPPKAKAVLVDLRQAITDAMPRLDGALAPEARDGACNQLMLKVDKLERRLMAAAKHREAATMRRIAGARAVLFPFGKAQERALNAVPLWSKYGDEFIGGIRRACADHAERMIDRAAVPA